MEKQFQAPVGFIDESFKGDLRIRLQPQAIDGSIKSRVDVIAQNVWAGQAKLLYAQGGIEIEDAKELFAFLTETLRGYDWHDNQVLLEED